LIGDLISILVSCSFPRFAGSKETSPKQAVKEHEYAHPQQVNMLLGNLGPRLPPSRNQGTNGGASVSEN